MNIRMERFTYDVSKPAIITAKIFLDKDEGVRDDLNVFIQHCSANYRMEKPFNASTIIAEESNGIIRSLTLGELTDSCPLGSYIAGVREGSGDRILTVGRPVVVYRRKVHIDYVQVEQAVYAPGDPIRINVRLTNYDSQPVKALKLTISHCWRHILFPKFEFKYPGEINLNPGESFQTSFFEIHNAGTEDEVSKFWVWLTQADSDRTLDLQLSESYVVDTTDLNGPFWYPKLYHSQRLADINDALSDVVPKEEHPGKRIGQAPSLPKRWIGIFPHVDDHLAYLPLIMRSIKEGVPFKIVYLCPGSVTDSSQEFFEYRYMDKEHEHYVSHVCYQEAIKHIEFLGGSAENLIAFGLPDASLYDLYFDSPADGTPLWLFDTATDRVSYPYAYKPGLPYHRDAIIQTLNELLQSFEPTDVYLPRPDECHLSHAITYYYVMDAVQALQKEQGVFYGIHVNQCYGIHEDNTVEMKFEPEPPIALTQQELERALQSIHFFQVPFPKSFHFKAKQMYCDFMRELWRPQNGAKWFRVINSQNYMAPHRVRFSK